VGPANHFTGVEDPLLNDAGTVAFIAHLAQTSMPTVRGSAIWTAPEGGTPVVIARDGDPIPGRGTPFAELGLAYLRLNDLDQVAFRGAFGSPTFSGTPTGAWLYDPDAAGLETLLIRYMNPPGLPSTEVDSVSVPALNDRGRALVSAFVSRADGTCCEPPDLGLWRSNSAGTLGLLFDNRTAPPGEPAGVFLTFRYALINDRRDVALWAEVDAPGYPPGANSIWQLDAAGRLEGVAVPGQQAPDLPTGVTFARAMGLKLNDAGQIALLATLEGEGVTPGNDRGIWLYDSVDGSAPELVVREGDLVPDLVGVSFLTLETEPLLSDSGVIVFQSVLAGAGVTLVNDVGLFHVTPDGIPAMIVREGDMMEVGPGDVRTVASFSLFFGGDVDRLMTSMNDRGDVAFQARFTDGTSGIFVAGSGLDVSRVGEGIPVGLSVGAALGLIIWRSRVGPLAPLPPD
jgi:hypothetical protein